MLLLMLWASTKHHKYGEIKFMSGRIVKECLIWTLLILVNFEDSKDANDSGIFWVKQQQGVRLRTMSARKDALQLSRT